MFPIVNHAQQLIYVKLVSQTTFLIAIFANEIVLIQNVMIVPTLMFVFLARHITN